MPGPPTDDELIARIEAFVLRARRVLAHSLCANMDWLTTVADGGMFMIRDNGVESIQFRYPSEEPLESLAARVRPLILQQDPIHYGRVLKALTLYLKRNGTATHTDWCAELRKDWASVDPLIVGDPGYIVSVSTSGSTEPGSVITDAELVGTWFYGDLVHADSDRIAKGSAFNINDRFAAAAVRVAQLAILTRDTHSFISDLVDDGTLPLDPSVLDEIPVKVEPRDLKLKGVYAAPAGTDPPSPAGQATGAEWSSPIPGTEDGQWQLQIPWGRSD